LPCCDTRLGNQHRANHTLPAPCAAGLLEFGSSHVSCAVRMLVAHCFPPSQHETERFQFDDRLTVLQRVRSLRYRASISQYRRSKCLLPMCTFMLAPRIGTQAFFLQIVRNARHVDLETPNVVAFRRCGANMGKTP
jgi:hypothetical protein